MSREEVQWTFHKELKHDSGIALRINILPLRKPIYSFEVGVLKEGGYLNRFFPGGLDWEIDFPTIVSGLIEEACVYINERLIAEAEESAKTEQGRLNKELNKRRSLEERKETMKKINKVKRA